MCRWDDRRTPVGQRALVALDYFTVYKFHRSENSRDDFRQRQEAG